MVSRRCTQREFLLRPSPETNALFRYVLAVSSKKHGILLHCCTALSDHYHVELTDPHGQLPKFDQHLNSLISRAMNRRLGRRESFWAPGSYSAVTLVTPADIIDKSVYILANPVSAALVQRAREWPGVWTPPELIGAGPVKVERPPDFFRSKGQLPATAELEFVPPPGFSAEEYRDLLSVGLANRETEVAERLARERRTVVGVRRILAQDPSTRAASPEAHRRLKPRIACLDPAKRAEAIARLRRFLDDYRLAWVAFARGLRETVFPHGTYWMRVAHGVRCEAPG